MSNKENQNNSQVELDKNEVALIKKDRMRFSKNKLSANLALLAIVFDVVYFVSIYKSNVEFYYNEMIGISVVCNLLFMLAVFLCSEGIKNYKPTYGIIMIVIGVLQLVRIVYYPLKGITTTYETVDGSKVVMGAAQFILNVVSLAASAGFLFGAGIIGIIRSKTLKQYRAEIGDEQPA